MKKQYIIIITVLIASLSHVVAQVPVKSDTRKVQIVTRENISNKAYILKLKPLDVTTTATSFTEIDGEEIRVEMENDGAVLIQFNATDTWNDGGAGTFYAIEVDGEIKAQSSATGYTGQRVPVLLSTIEKLSKGTHVLKTKWHTQTGGRSYMGRSSPYQFMAIKL